MKLTSLIKIFCKNLMTAKFRSLLTIIFAVFIFLNSSFSAEALSQYQKYGITNYTTTPSGSQTMDWLNDKFDMAVSGKNPQDPNTLWVGYFDLAIISTPQALLEFKDWAYANLANPEAALLHAKIDFTSTIQPTWEAMDGFGIFQAATWSPTYYNGVNGVWLETSPGTFVDKTVVAQRGVSPYITLSDNSNLYVGYEEPFDQANFNFGTFASNLIGTWQYWNGNSWANLSVTDETNVMTQNGQLLFVPPSAWAKTNVNAGRSKYFIRFAETSASIQPIINTIKGDTWLTVGKSRGWDSTSPTIVNAGTSLEYNPTPPAASTAKFPYQARITGWASNHFMINPADQQIIGGSEKRTWAQFVAYYVNQQADANGWTGFMGDDGGTWTSFSGISIADTDFVDTPNVGTAEFEYLGRYQEIVDTLNAIRPEFKVGLNSTKKQYVLKGDFNLAEYHLYAYNTGSGCIAIGVTDMCYDDYLTVNNPKNVFGMLLYADVVSTIASGTVQWDRSNRGPIISLANHLIGANENTYFSYYSNGGFIYSENDEVILNDNSIVHQATQPTPELSTVKRWAAWFPAMGIDFGIPDIGGWNGGVRSFAWKTGDELTWENGADAYLQQVVDTNTAIDIANNTISLAGSKWTDRAKVRFVGSNLPAPLLENTTYWVTNTADGIAKLSTTDWDAYMASIGNAGYTIDLTSTGSGNFKIYRASRDVWRRDYTNAIILERSAMWNTSAAEYNTFSAPIDLGGTYYQLTADGKTSAAITSVALRVGEGAILMKAPTGIVDMVIPSAPSGLGVL